MSLSPVALVVSAVARLTALAEPLLHDDFGVWTETHKGDVLTALLLRRPGIAGEVCALSDDAARQLIAAQLQNMQIDDPIIFDRDLGPMPALALCFFWFGHTTETGHTYQKGYIVRNFIDLDVDERRTKTAMIRRQCIAAGHDDPWPAAIETAKQWAARGIVKPNMRSTGIPATAHGAPPPTGFRSRTRKLFRGITG